MPGAIWTSSHPSAPKLSRICLAACVRIGAVRYSHLVMLGTLLAGEHAELVAFGVGQHVPVDDVIRAAQQGRTAVEEELHVGRLDVPVDAVLDRLGLRDVAEDQLERHPWR